MRLLVTFFAFLLSAALYGQNDYSMSFDGVDDYVSTSTDIFTNSDVQRGTVSCNVNLNDTLGDRHIFSLEGYVDIGLRKANSSVISCSWPLTSINAVSDGSSLCGGTGVYYPINLISNTNEWINISITWDGVSFIKMYIDGDLVSSSIPSSPPEIDNLSRSLTFGVHSSFNWSNYLEGNLDNIQLWDIPLSSQEIGQYISCPPVGNESGLIGLWDFEEASGFTVFDQTANGNDVTIHGATWSTEVSEQNCVFCTDPLACNYNPYAFEDDGSCDYTCCPGPGCCDEGLQWDWELSLCQDLNPTDTNLDGCTDLNDLMDILAAYGDCAVTEAEFTCGDEIEHEGYNYSTVQIGDQCWFSENCRYLPEVSPSSEGSETAPYYYVYDYEGTDVTAAMATANYDTYGVLYNWPAVMAEGVCPSGWHIPSDEEWQTMEMSLGMSEADAADTGWRGTGEGYQMKSTSGWNNNGNGSNSSGFTGLPGGYRSGGYLGGIQGYFGGFPNYRYSWTASEAGSSNNDSASWARLLYEYNDNVGRGDYTTDMGYAARCVRD